MPTPKITPCLWYDGTAEEAASLYVSLLPDSRIDRVVKTPADTPGPKAGDVITVEFTLAGSPFIALNGGPMFKFTEAVSFQIELDTQAEMDRLTEALSAVPEAEQCGWIKDRFGLSWQIVPRQLQEWIAGPDKEAGKRVTEAMLEMKRLDLAALRRAYEG